MANSKEYELAIKIAGEIEKSFYNSTKLTKKELSEIARQAAKTSGAAAESSGTIAQSFAKSLKDSEPAFSGMEKVAKASFKAISVAAAATGAAVAAGIGATISAGSEFESSFAGVKKTVNATDEELAQMRNEIREMAKDMPTSAAGLSEIAESAGQLGIQTKNITSFARTMANLEVATNLTREEGASEFAKFANITEMSQENFENLGSSVVALGNNMATTEADIMAMGMRIAAAGSQVKLSQAQIMGYSAALSSVGIEAEAGGSAFSKLLVNLQMAVETGKGLASYSQVAGMTGEEFKRAFQDDAAVAVNAFLKGLNDTERNGKSAIAILDDMGLTEVRLRDTLLRAANASDLFEDALKTSSDAWKENTALTKEAEQRYATFESQCDILGNKVTDVGISLYDDMRPGLTEVIGLVNDFIDGMAGQEDAVGDFIESATKKLPTMVRQTKEAGQALKDFAEPFLAVGGWLADNPGVIVSTIAGVGTALTTYKVASGIASLAASLGALGPAGIGIMAVGGTAAVIAGIGIAVKKSAAEAKRANLDRHFGDISLSMQELQDTAAYIVKSKSLDKVRQSLEAMDELDGIADQIEAATEEIDKMNWKVSIGMELTDTEKESYQDQIRTFLEQTHGFVEQQQYAVTMSVGTLVGDDLEGSNIVTQLNQFYSDKQGELADLGTQLNQTVTDAFQDGLLDIDEVEEISRLQEQIANIRSALAGSDFEAGLDLIATKYGGKQLDADSFQNLQAEVQSQMDEAMASYDEAYKTSMSQLHMMRTEGGWSQQQYDSAATEVNAGYLQQKADLQARAVQFQMDTIKQAYGAEWDSMVEQLKQTTGERLGDSLMSAQAGGNNDLLNYVPEGIVKEMKGQVDRSTRDALGALYEQMQPLLQQMEETADQYRQAGKTVPESIQQGIADTSALGGLSGNAEALWGIVGQTAESEEYQSMITQIQDAGGYVPEQIAQAISDNQGVIDDAVRTTYANTQEMINQTFGDGGLSIPLNLLTAPKSKESTKSSVPGHAEGGIFDRPHIAWFAEKGPEAAIPLDGSRNAISLWEKTGELLGMNGLTGGGQPMAAGVEQAVASGSGSVQIEYRPTLQFYGSAPSREDLESALETDREKFTRQMEQWLKDNRRFSFS